MCENSVIPNEKKIPTKARPATRNTGAAQVQTGSGVENDLSLESYTAHVLLIYSHIVALFPHGLV